MYKKRISDNKKISKISKADKQQLNNAVKKIIKEYGEALRMLGNK